MEYKDLFKKKLKEYGVSSPAQIPDDKKDDFFLELDKMWNSADEKGKDGLNASLRKLPIGGSLPFPRKRPKIRR